MKILKEGKVRDKLYNGSCYDCGCVVECNEAEVVFTAMLEAWVVKCPTTKCGRHIRTLPKMYDN